MEHIGRAGRKPSVFRSRFSVMNHEKTPILWRASSLTSCLCACMYISMYACMHVLYCNIMMLRSVMQRNATQCNAMQHTATQSNAVQCNTAQCNTISADPCRQQGERVREEGTRGARQEVSCKNKQGKRQATRRKQRGKRKQEVRA